ncbi:hypothetical protein [Winogradskyella sp. PC D3.3]
MKIEIVSVICLGIIALIVVGCVNYIGISKKQAAQNLKAYLDREYQGELSYSDLKRFFNAATIDPNIFGVLIYNKEIPEIEFYTYINAKHILEDDTLPLYAKSDSITFEDLYQEAVKRYKTRQTIKADFKKDIPEIEFTTDAIHLIFDEDLNPEVLELLLTRFVKRLNQSYEDLDSIFKYRLLIKTPEHPDGFIDIPLESDGYQWHAQPITLSENCNNFEDFKTLIEAAIQAKLDTAYPHFKINDYRKLYLDKTSLSKGAWVQYLDDKNVHNTLDGIWVNPQKGIYIVYFDLQTQFIYRGEMLTEDSDKMTYNERVAKIKEALAAEGLTIN